MWHDDTSREFGHDCNWNAVTNGGRWMCNRSCCVAMMDTPRHFGDVCSWNAVTDEGRWMWSSHHLMKRSIQRYAGWAGRWKYRKESSETPPSCLINGVLVVSVMCSLIRVNGEDRKMTVLSGARKKWRRWCREKFAQKMEIVQETAGKAQKMEGQRVLPGVGRKWRRWCREEFEK